MSLQSKMTVYAALAGVLALMGGIVYYASLDNTALEQVEIKLKNIELIDDSTTNNQAKFDVTFLVKNPSDKAFAVSLIQFKIYGDGVLLGSGQYSTTDIPLPGRVIFDSGAEIPLKSTFVMSKSEVGPEIYQSVIDNKINSFIAEGSIRTSSSWSVIEKEFKTGF